MKGLQLVFFAIAALSFTASGVLASEAQAMRGYCAT